MLLAVTIFNSGNYRFKTEVFAVLANIAWTYLLHEHYERSQIPPLNADGTTFALRAFPGKIESGGIFMQARI
jgi:hypothetical protein